MITFVALLIAIATVAFIAYPLFRQKPVTADSTGSEALRELQSRKDTAYSMLKEIEFDYKSGILAEEDYRTLEDRYKQKAVSTLKEIDTVTKVAEDEVERQVRRLRKGKGKMPTANTDDDIEREIAQHRQSKGRPVAADAGDDIEKEIQQHRQSKGQSATASMGQVRFCSQCGGKISPSDRFCSRCGASLKK